MMFISMVSIWLVFSSLYFVIFLMHCFCSKKLTEVAFNQKEKREPQNTKSQIFFKGAKLNGGVDLAMGPGHRASGPVFSEDPSYAQVQLVACLGSQVIPANLVSTQLLTCMCGS